MKFAEIQNQLIEQKITKQVTIADGSSGSVSITIPKETYAYLKGYGYTYSASSTFQLITGQLNHPKRSDQAGSPSLPVQWSNPFPVNPGDKVTFNITNGSGGAITYDVVFYFLVDKFLNEESTGGELILNVGSGSGGVATQVQIVNSSGLSADVIARGDGHNAVCVDTEMDFSGATLYVSNIRVGSTDQTSTNSKYLLVETDGTLVNKEAVSSATPIQATISVATSSTSVASANSSRRSLFIQNISDEDIYLKINATAVSEEGIKLLPNQAISFSYKEGNLFTSAVNGICASGSKKLLVVEW